MRGVQRIVLRTSAIATVAPFTLSFIPAQAHVERLLHARDLNWDERRYREDTHELAIEGRSSSSTRARS